MKEQKAPNGLIAQTFLGKGYVEQFFSTVACALMESNSYGKTGIKKSVPHDAITKGKVYRLKRNEVNRGNFS